MDSVDELEEAFEMLNNTKGEELLDTLALQNAIMHYAKSKLSNAYNVEDKEDKEMFRWILLNKNLCSKNNILSEINANYFKIYSNRFKPTSNEVINASKEIINLLNKDLSEISEDVPLNVIKREYNKFCNNRR